MRPIVLTKALAAADDDAVALIQAPVDAGNLTLNGALVTAGVAILGPQRRILITSAGNDSGITFTVTGTNDSGTAITETVTGANAATVATSQDFATISRIANSGAVAGAGVRVGTNAVGSTPWQVPNYHITPFELAVAARLLSGAATGTLEFTDDSPMMPIPIYQTGYSQAMPVPSALGWPGMVGIPGLGQGLINRPIAAWRWTTTAGTGTVQITGRQSGIRN